MKNLCLLFLVGLATGFISEKLLVASQSPTTFDLYIEGHSSGDLPIDDEDDDDDGSGSGSGDYGFSPDVKDEILSRIFNFSQTSLPKETSPLQPQPTAGSPHNPTTTAADSQDSVTTAKDSVTPPFIFNDGSNGREEMTGGENEESVGTTPSSLDTTTPATSQADISMETADEDDYNSLDSSKVTTTKIVNRDHSLHDSPGRVISDNIWERTDVLAAVIACGVVGLLCAIFLLTLLAYRMKKKDEGSYDLGDNKLSSTAYHKAPTKEFYA